MSVLEASSAPCLSSVEAGAATALPERAVVTKALSPTDSRLCGERTLTSSILPMFWPSASTVPSVRIEISESLRRPRGIVMPRLDDAAEAGDEAALVVDVQVAVARQAVAAVGELDLDEALALEARRRS